MGRGDRREADRLALALPIGDAAAGRLVDLERADDPADVVVVDLGRRLRVDPAELLMQRVGAARFGLERHALAEGLVGRGRRDLPAFEQGPDVLAGAADDDRQATTGLDIGDRGARVVKVFGERDRLSDVSQIEAVVRHPFAVGIGRFGGADVQAAVELTRVGADDLTVELLGELQRPARLPRGGRSDDGKDRQLVGQPVRRRRCAG